MEVRLKTPLDPLGGDAHLYHERSLKTTARMELEGWGRPQRLGILAVVPLPESRRGGEMGITYYLQVVESTTVATIMLLLIGEDLIKYNPVPVEVQSSCANQEILPKSQGGVGLTSGNRATREDLQGPVSWSASVKKKDTESRVGKVLYLLLSSFALSCQKLRSCALRSLWLSRCGIAES
jgi:hypothetical protein